jgi:hypothetical protein
MRKLVPVAAALVLTACVPHPVGPARTFGKYEGKAATTAESALSAVRTAQLVAVAATRHRLFGPYVATVISEAEEDVSGVLSTFASIQPPDERADALREELTSLLDDAGDHLSTLRIAARRGRNADLAGVAGPLTDDGDKLEKFADAH